MEQRPPDRGTRSDSLRRRCRRPALQWSHVLTNVETKEESKRRYSQHEASMEPRPHERGNPKWPSPACWSSGGLQWSHVLTNVETDGFAGVAVEEEEASMEPRPHERGNAGDVVAQLNALLGFNGATSSRTWKRRDERHSPCRVFASMEPRPHERGNLRVNLD